MVTLDYLLVRNAHPIGISNVIMSSKVVNYELMDIYIYTHTFVLTFCIHTYIYIYIYTQTQKGGAKFRQGLHKVGFSTKKKKKVCIRLLLFKIHILYLMLAV